MTAPIPGTVHEPSADRIDPRHSEHLAVQLGKALAQGRVRREQRPHLGYRNQGRRPWEAIDLFVRQGA